METMDFKSLLRTVPDFPKPGINFIDVTTLTGDAAGLKTAADELARPFADKGVQYVIGIESRGFIFGAMVAERLGAAFVPVRKPGKLPARTVRETYELEYGSDTVEMHADAFPAGAKVLLVDDLLATGGTMAAACKLVDSVGGQIVGIGFVVELDFLHGREKLAGHEVHSLVHYEA